MTSILRLERFVKDYQTLVPSLKFIAFPIYKMHLKTLVDNYLQNSNHPFPQEFLGYLKLLASQEKEHQKAIHK